jgi:Spy/CpxP family protein refolding chaperone
MKRKLMTIVLVLSLGLNLGIIFTFGHHWFMEREFRKGPGESSWFKNKMKKELNLTDEQVNFMEQDRAAIHQEVKALREELQKKRSELFKLVDAEKVDNQKIDHLINDLAQLQVKLEKVIIGHLLTMKSHLTPEQQKKLREAMKKGPMKMPPEQDFERGEHPPR